MHYDKNANFGLDANFKLIVRFRIGERFGAHLRSPEVHVLN